MLILMPFNPEDFISGGYFLTKRVQRPRDVSDLIPESFLTISNCFASLAPDMWAEAGYNYEPQERVEKAAEFGIPASALPALVELFTSTEQPHHSNAFPKFAVAREFYRHCADKNSIALLGIGLEPSLVESFRSQLTDDVNHGYGLEERIKLNNRLAPAGTPLGFEPLGYDATKFHSWLCHNAPVEALQKFGVRPNSMGFIDSLEDAVRVTRDLKATGAEPAIWEPWLIVQYAA
ncbi:MAG TPA: hypothetical protein VE783_04090 [Candidatus Limnocylindrales bacterium]|nr:hypothetical protein [Candidatus Limnocylindrales bacterium]